MKTWWTDIEAEGEPWLGLQLHVEDRPSLPPFFHVETSSYRRLRVLAGERPIIWAAILPRYEGVWVLRSFDENTTLPVAPIRSAQVQNAPGSMGEVEWFAYWSRHFARALSAEDRFLYDAEWLLRAYTTSVVEPPWRFEALRPERFGYENVTLYNVANALDDARLVEKAWGLAGSGDLITLRQKPREGEGRVKMWRKVAREGHLPPLLAWYISGLDAYLLLDGHRRLLASRLEGIPPAVLTLTSYVERDFFDPTCGEMMVREYERFQAGPAQSQLNPRRQVDSPYAAGTSDC